MLIDEIAGRINDVLDLSLSGEQAATMILRRAGDASPAQLLAGAIAVLHEQLRIIAELEGAADDTERKLHNEIICLKHELTDLRRKRDR